MKEKWVVTTKKADFQKTAKDFGVDPVIARVIRNRDITEPEDIRQYLYGTIKDIPSPWLMKDMEKAAGICEAKIKERKPIRIIGDYDIDGVMSTYILLKGLRRLGADVDTYIPDRVADGYGIHEHLIRQAKTDGKDTIITCDNGIAAVNEIAQAKKEGMTVIVTDHHEIPFREENGIREYILPPADAVLNPRQKGCSYPNKNLCGAAVAWKFISALYERAGIPQTELEEFYELAGFATVGDIMDLKGENRILVKEGLKRLPNTKNYGLKALIRVNGLEHMKITAYHIGFVLGPCINATGRLDTAVRALQLLDSGSQDEAERLAGDLKALNESRKAMTEIGCSRAEEIVESTELKNDKVLVVFLPDCHESLAGIIAGRLREKYHRPVFVLTQGEHGIKGSGRSVEVYSMFEEMTKCRELLEQFGGHPMAAGLSLREENVDRFRRRINELCTLTDQDLIPKVVIDVPVPVSYLTMEFVRQLSLLEPFGKGNTKPLFAQKDLAVLNMRMIGKNQNVLKMRLRDKIGTMIDGICFGNVGELYSLAKEKGSISVTYYPEINCYLGRESLQIIIQNYF
ncbi:MAG: single-stranded-DNA-specific exonuclease RecJ [Blautia sp.]|nr:single-stranded-DNA-specific exonuclease RecJ [Blautia sp.]MDY5030607.1 single-stranded-DNA-specific exonuclease RecJ [Blautia sp.]